MNKLFIYRFSKKAKWSRATGMAAGLDLVCCNEVPVLVSPTKPSLIPLGIAAFTEPPSPLLLCFRSSTPFKGLSIPSGLGIIDPDYRGQIHLSVIAQEHVVEVHPGEKLCQLIPLYFPLWTCLITTTKELGKTERGDAGFGQL